MQGFQLHHTTTIGEDMVKVFFVKISPPTPLPAAKVMVEFCWWKDLHHHYHHWCDGGPESFYHRKNPNGPGQVEREIQQERRRMVEVSEINRTRISIENVCNWNWYFIIWSQLNNKFCLIMNSIILSNLFSPNQLLTWLSSQFTIGAEIFHILWLLWNYAGFKPYSGCGWVVNCIADLLRRVPMKVVSIGIKIYPELLLCLSNRIL